MIIALAGNPNSGKTTLFNAITGKTEYVGNWPGVTVEKKEASLKKRYNKGGQDIKIVDLPGTYSISPFTGEEAITRDFILGENPDVIINIVDGANISRSLFFTTQLLELGIPVVLAINKSDVITKRGDTVDLLKLAKTLDCRVIPITATTGEGLSKLMDAAILTAQEKKKQKEPNFEGKESADSDKARQRFIDSIIEECQVITRDVTKVSISDKIDSIVAHKWLGIPIFFLIMWGLFSLAIGGPGGYLSEMLNEVVFGEMIPDFVNNLFNNMGVHPFLHALVVDGAIGGVGAVIGFLPIIMILFFLLALLEDCGYMARVAVIMDRYLKKIGLSGKAIIPMLVGAGCSVPGVMATRTIENVHERRITTILTPFVPCGAKIPIIALFVAVFFPNSPWVGASMYIIAFSIIILAGLFFKKVFASENLDSSQFIIELPEYKIPSLSHAFIQMIDKGKSFIYKAGTIILVCNTLVWFAQAYDFSLQAVEDQSLSILAIVGSVITPIFVPIGFIGWQLAVASITGLIAKENVVATFAVLLAVASEEALHLPGGALTQFFTPVTAFAFLVYNLFSPPCFAAIGAMNTEFNSKKWLFRAVGFQFGVGYLAAMLITQIGTPIFYGKLAAGFVPAVLIAIITVIAIIVFIKKKNIKHTKVKAA
ncbi:MAG: ferrous iron transporter B [Peptostreptococcales bacterium]